MLHIAICDDEKAFVDHLKELLSQYILENRRGDQNFCFL